MVLITIFQNTSSNVHYSLNSAPPNTTNLFLGKKKQSTTFLMVLYHLRLDIIFSQLSTLALGPTQSPIKQVPWFCLDSNAADV